ncbi:MAG: BamA/TamA family outer membrane protein [Planctomycetota bacterium]
MTFWQLNEPTTKDTRQPPWRWIVVATLCLWTSSAVTLGQQTRYPYPAPANRQTVSNRQAPSFFRTARAPAPLQQSNGQPMAIPFSGQSFGVPSINQQPATITPPIFSAQPGSGINLQSNGTFQSPVGPSPQPIVGSQVPGIAPNLNPGLNPNLSPVFQAPNGPGGIGQGLTPLDIDVFVPQGPTQRIALGGTYSSDSGLIGELIFDERDFNLFAFPRNFNDLADPRLFRGGGQTLRVEVVPGTDLERYVVNFADPYFLNSDYSLSVSGYYFDRQYFDWDEERAGGRISIGRNLTNYLSVNAGLRLENVKIDNLRLGTSPQLNANLGNNDLYQFSLGLVYDTRQSPFLVDSGSYLALTYKQAFGEFDYARGEIDYRVQRLLFQRSPTSGHHTLSFRTKLGFSGSDTPVFENYIAGGFSSMRGFDFRGIGPIENGVRVGGEFQWLNSLEYQFPITQDDMISAVTFIDFGTVEESVELNSENFRVVPGVGLRVQLPFAGMAAPLAFDFGFPVSDATGDEQRTFSFVVGAIR